MAKSRNIIVRVAGAAALAAALAGAPALAFQALGATSFTLVNRSGKDWSLSNSLTLNARRRR